MKGHGFLRFITLFTLLGLLLIGCSTESLTDALETTARADMDSNVVSWWWGDPAGTSNIVRTDNGIGGNVASSLSNPEQDGGGLAVTLWIVVFNDPDECATSPCSASDLFVPAVMPDVLYGAGNVVGGSENVRLGYHINEGDNSGSIANLFGMPTNSGEPWGLIYPRSAEIHYVVRTHGPIVPAEMPEQIHTYGGGCVFGAPFGYPSPTGADDLHFGVGDCQDIQFAINVP